MKISINQGKQNKIHVLCDDEYTFTVDAEYWFSSPYHGISNIEDEEELAAFYEAVGSRCAFIAGLRLLSYRDHSRKELIKVIKENMPKKPAKASNITDISMMNAMREALPKVLLKEKA